MVPLSVKPQIALVKLSLCCRVVDQNQVPRILVDILDGRAVPATVAVGVDIVAELEALVELRRGQGPHIVQINVLPEVAVGAAEAPVLDEDPRPVPGRRAKHNGRMVQTSTGALGAGGLDDLHLVTLAEMGARHFCANERARRGTISARNPKPKPKPNPRREKERSRSRDRGGGTAVVRASRESLRESVLVAKVDVAQSVVLTTLTLSTTSDRIVLCHLEVHAERTMQDQTPSFRLLRMGLCRNLHGRKYL